MFTRVTNFTDVHFFQEPTSLLRTLGYTADVKSLENSVFQLDMRNASLAELTGLMRLFLGDKTVDILKSPGLLLKKRFAQMDQFSNGRTNGRLLELLAYAEDMRPMLGDTLEFRVWCSRVALEGRITEELRSSMPLYPHPVGAPPGVASVDEKDIVPKEYDAVRFVMEDDDDDEDSDEFYYEVVETTTEEPENYVLYDIYE